MNTTDKNITILNHPVIKHNLAILRDENTDCEKFKNALKRITYALIFEATKNLTTIETKIQTPICETTCEIIDNNLQVIIAPILRAGLAFSEIAQEILPFANVHHIGMYRDEQTLEPVWYYDKKKDLKKDKNKIFAIILDPMLATGNSAVDSIKNFIEKGVKEENIIFVSLISSPVGIEKVNSKFSNVKIITSQLDNELNSKGYIVPGLGDAGDRIFNTID